MKKRILIDASTVSEKTDGLTQYIINLLSNFPDDSFEQYDFSVLVNKNVTNVAFINLMKLGKFKKVEYSVASIGPKRDISFFFFFLKNKNTLDLFHSTSNQYPICLKNGIATVHDITFETYFLQKWWTFNLAKNYLSVVIKQSLKKARSVIAVSNYTKNLMVSKYHLNDNTENKINVIHEGWEHLVNDDIISNTQAYQNNYGRYFLYVGSTKQHKNMKRLLEAYLMALKELPDINLVLTGNETFLSAEEIEIVYTINKNKKVVFFTGHVATQILKNLFKSAEAFIFPSLSEGFGIPVLEAFYFEKPLLCSNTTSLPEIAGDAAIYFNPESVEDISRAMVFFYNNPELASSMIEKGKQRLKEFSWRKAAIETIELYDRHLKKMNI